MTLSSSIFSNSPVAYLSLFLVVFTLTLAFPVLAYANPHLSVSPSSGQLETDGGSINVVVDSGEDNLKSSTAVIEYDPSKVSIEVVDGSFFPIVTSDTSASNEVVITGTLTIGDSIGVTGSGTLATLNITPLVDSGSFTLTFRCDPNQSDDSNIINMNDENLLATSQACGNNINGSYTIGSGGDGDPAPQSNQCNASCVNNSDCPSDLICHSGYCRNPDCVSATDCTCPTNGTATTQTQPDLPDELLQTSGSDWVTWFFAGITLVGAGLLFLLMFWGVTRQIR